MKDIQTKGRFIVLITIKRFFLSLLLMLSIGGCSTSLLKDRFSGNQETGKTETNAQLQTEANRLYKAGDLDSAEQKYLELIKINAKDSHALYRLGNIAFKRGRLKEAVEFFSQTIEVSPRSQKAQYNLAITYLTLSEQHFKFFSSMVDGNTDLTKVSQILKDIYEFSSAGPVNSQAVRSVKAGDSRSQSRTGSQSRSIKKQNVPSATESSDDRELMNALDSLVDQF